MGVIFYEASIDDKKFINDLVVDGSKQGHFNRKIESSSGITSWEIDLISILNNKVRSNGLKAHAYIYAHNDTPIGFFIMSVFKRGMAEELWMASIVNEYREKGFGTRMLNGILEQVNTQGSKLLARCSSDSTVAYKMLVEKGFNHIGYTEDNYRILGYHGQ